MESIYVYRQIYIYTYQVWLLWTPREDWRKVTSCTEYPAFLFWSLKPVAVGLLQDVGFKVPIAVGYSVSTEGSLCSARPCCDSLQSTGRLP